MRETRRWPVGAKPVPAMTQETTRPANAAQHRVQTDTTCPVRLLTLATSANMIVVLSESVSVTDQPFVVAEPNAAAAAPVP